MHIMYVQKSAPSALKKKEFPHVVAATERLIGAQWSLQIQNVVIINFVNDTKFV